MQKSGGNFMSNHLKGQSSPYLLQHMDNPVDWYPWGEAAFEKAKKENKPVFLSIGYSTCHWCHVMAHESFEDPEIAKILNQCFVSIKVDREERPDIDHVYMNICQVLTGNGGWPLSIFMTPNQKPFFAGTYFPPISGGMIGFRELLLAIADKWESNRSELLQSAQEILTHIHPVQQEEQTEIREHLIDQAVKVFFERFDKKYGGFGSAPKFPAAHNLIFLMLYAQRKEEQEIFYQVDTTLEKMRRGGIFDQIGYGFSRYSTDPYFLVPHFEKMLYDNALLILAYSLAYKIGHCKIFLDTAEKTAEYILREMTGEQGQFYSSQDADSEGEEGKYYVWTYKEICELLGKEKGREFCSYYGITKQGNFEGKNIPNLLNSHEICDPYKQERNILYDYRKKRTALLLDDKVLMSWNALMICAMVVLYRITKKEKYFSAAENCYHFLENNLVEQNLVFVSWRNGNRSVHGFLDDYAYYTMALLTLYETSHHTNYLKRAEEICQEIDSQFKDNKGGYFLYGSKNSKLITRPKETYDGALPSGNSIIAYCLVRLSQLTQKEKYEQAAKKQLAFMSSEARYYPAGYSMFLTAMQLYLYPPQKIIIVLSKQDKEENIRKNLPEYADITIYTQPKDGYQLLNGKTTYYICKNHTCLPPSNKISGM